MCGNFNLSGAVSDDPNIPSTLELATCKTCRFRSCHLLSNHIDIVVIVIITGIFFKRMCATLI